MVETFGLIWIVATIFLGCPGWLVLSMVIMGRRRRMATPDEAQRWTSRDPGQIWLALFEDSPSMKADPLLKRLRLARWIAFFLPFTGIAVGALVLPNHA